MGIVVKYFMEIMGEWLQELEAVYLISIRGLWKIPEVDGFLTNFFNTDTMAHYVIIDPTDAMLPTELVRPSEPWSLDDALAQSIQYYFLKPHFQRYVRVVNNDLPYFELTQHHFEALGVRHKVHHVQSLIEAKGFIASHQQASGSA